MDIGCLIPVPSLKPGKQRPQPGWHYLQFHPAVMKKLRSLPLPQTHRGWWGAGPLLLASPGWGDTAEASQPYSTPAKPSPPCGALHILPPPWLESHHPPQLLLPSTGTSTKKYFLGALQSSVHHQYFLLLFCSLGDIFKRAISIKKLPRADTTPKVHAEALPYPSLLPLYLPGNQHPKAIFCTDPTIPPPTPPRSLCPSQQRCSVEPAGSRSWRLLYITTPGG